MEWCSQITSGVLSVNASNNVYLVRHDYVYFNCLPLCELAASGMLLLTQNDNPKGVLGVKLLCLVHWTTNLKRVRDEAPIYKAQGQQSLGF